MGKMREVRIILFFLVVLLFFSCENRVRIDEIENVISKNDLNIQLKIDVDNDFEIQKVLENKNSNSLYLKIDVDNKFSIRGKTEIEIKKKYRLSITLKNINANPVINYSFWKGLKTSVRSYTLAGENGNPPTSKTQDIYNDWVTFDEYFEAEEGEDSFMLSLFCESGTFYIKEIKIEEVKE